MRWLYVTYIIYWSSVAITAALAALGYPLVDPQAVARAFNETASLPYEQRFLQSAVDVAFVSLFSYPALFYAATVYGIATATLAGAFGAGHAFLYAAVVQIVLFFLTEVAKWHPLVQRLSRGRVEWRRYLLWVAAAFSLVGVLSL